MNINDVEDYPYPNECWMEMIFKKQTELMQKYHAIEKKNGLLQIDKLPIPLDDRFGQARIKDFAWRFTEEVAEAHECLEVLPLNSIKWIDIPELSHYREELIDALHFLTELTIMVDIKPMEISYASNPEQGTRLYALLGSDIPDPVTVKDLFAQSFTVIMRMGILCNLLKNKPWKQTHQLTDKGRFTLTLIQVWYAFFGLLKMAGFDSVMVYDYYFRKSEVNKFRQRSNY